MKWRCPPQEQVCYGRCTGRFWAGARMPPSHGHVRKIEPFGQLGITLLVYLASLRRSAYVAQPHCVLFSAV